MNSEEIKILLLLNGISRNTGGMSSALDLAETLYGLNYRISICLTSSRFLYCIRGIKNNIIKVPIGNIYTIPNEFESIKSMAKRTSFKKTNFAGIIKTLTKKVIHVLLDRKNDFYQLLKEADIIIDAAGFSGKGFRLIRQNTKASIIYNHAGSPKVFEDYWLTDDYLLEPATSRAERYINYCKRYDAILFQGFDQANACIEREASFKSKCYVVPPSCQEASVLASKQSENPYRVGRDAIVCVGSIQARKAQHLAIEAFSVIAGKYTNVDLHFVGGGTETVYGLWLQELIDNGCFNQRVFFHGHRQDYLRFMAHATFVLQTSEEEGVSRILREAMLMKTPILSFAISGTVSLLKAGENALLIEPGNVVAMADGMAYLLDNPTTADGLAEAAHKRYLSNNSWPAYATSLMEMIDNLMHKKGTVSY